MAFIYCVIFFTSFIAVVVSLRAVWIFFLRLEGVYPKKGEAKISDVERLIREGRESLAIRCYREVNTVDLKNAKDAVDLMASRIV